MAVLIKDYISKVPASLNSITTTTLANCVLIPIAGQTSVLAKEDNNSKFISRPDLSTCVIFSLTISNKKTETHNVNICIMSYDTVTSPTTPTAFDFHYVGNNLPVPASSTLLFQAKITLNPNQALCVFPAESGLGTDAFDVSASVATMI